MNRGIALIDYDDRGKPVRIQFMDGSVTDFSAAPGMGVYGTVGGVRYVCGNARLMEREGPDAL